MSWIEFESRFLSRRGIYKGIFVQNVVIPWNDSLFQRPQQMALALGRLGYLVIYKTPYPSLDEVAGVRNVAPNVYLTSDEHFDFIEGAVHSTYSTTAVHPSDLAEGREFSPCTIYEYVDHVDPKISGSEENVRRLLASKRFAFDEDGFDFVVASARQLEDEAVEAVGRDKVILVPNGVDVWHYRNPAHERFHLPEELLKFRNEYENVVGYFGAIAPWLWYDEITKLVNGRPDLGFVFIGPDNAGDAVGRLPKTRNVLWLDQVSYDTLPAYANRFDVCFIPFEPGEIADTTSPLKLFEYFALEKPVVVTSRMREWTAFDVVFPVTTPVHCPRRSMKPSGPNRIRRSRLNWPGWPMKTVGTTGHGCWRGCSSRRRRPFRIPAVESVSRSRRLLHASTEDTMRQP